MNVRGLRDFGRKRGPMRTTIKSILVELRAGLWEMYGDRLREVLLFGSQARGDAEPGSDIDVMVVLHGPVAPSREIPRVGALTTSLSLKHDAVLSCVFISSDRFDREQSPLLLYSSMCVVRG